MEQSRPPSISDRAVGLWMRNGAWDTRDQGAGGAEAGGAGAGIEEVGGRLMGRGVETALRI